MLQAEKIKKFKFHRVGFIDADGKEESSWLALLETQEQLDVWVNWMAYQNAHAWFGIKDSPENKTGHCRTTRANVMKDLLEIKMFNEGRKSMPMIECISHIEHISTATIIKLFYQDGEVYVNKNGGCRDTRIRNDNRIKERIFERCANRDFIFPSVSKNVVKITKWPGAKHFYIGVNGTNVIVNGESKFNTIEAAEEAKKDFIKENRFKKI